MSDFGIIGNIARFIISIFIIFIMLNEVLMGTEHCYINIFLYGFLLLWLGTFQIWR